VCHALGPATSTAALEDTGAMTQLMERRAVRPGLMGSHVQAQSIARLAAITAALMYVSKNVPLIS
jgi:hypothetical protein